eukprot:CAMPEP_0177624034 /NCGR_PEP_ID=MMETSP0419_2-20121207/29250_1 /TAXON_ID=582737 /ORGANISM="Tetraselmis sp., Strain GSL018" /LENGTH=1404 /DNA_ID=CAMNT_0019124685 /DNA_START=457 /DNA_END=4668 /DNA_ORIENTATION=-
MDGISGSVADQNGAAAAAAATAYSTWETYRALPTPDRPYDERDVQIMAEILRTAEQASNLKPGQPMRITLLQLINAYETVLKRIGEQPAEDVFYYRFLLKLALDPDPDWWAKFRKEVESEGLTPGDSCRTMHGLGRSMAVSMEGYAPPCHLHDPSESQDLSSQLELSGSEGMVEGMLRRTTVSSVSSRGTRGARGHSVENWMIAVSFWECKICQRCLQQWHKRVLDLLGISLKHWQVSVTSRMFGDWWGAVHCGWEGHRCASLHHETVRRRTVLQLWAGAAQRQRDQREEEERWLMRQYIQKWLDVARFLAQVRKASDKVSVVVQLRAAGQFWTLWRQAFLRRVTHRHLLQEAMEDSAQRVKTKVFQAWWLNADTNNALRERISKLVARMTSVRACTAAGHMACNNCGLALPSQAGRGLCSVPPWAFPGVLLRLVEKLGQWQGSTAQKDEEAVDCLANLRVAAVLSSWQQFSKQQRADNDKVARSVRQVQNGLLSRALSGWQHRAFEFQWKRALLRCSSVHFIHRLLAVAYFTWNDWSNQRSSRRAKAACVIAAAIHRLETRTLQGWVDYVINRQQKTWLVEKALCYMANTFLSKALQGWTHAVELRHHKMELRHKAVGHMANTALRRAMNGLQHALAFRQLQAQLAVRTAARLANGRARQGFQGWHLAASLRKHKRQVVERSLRRMGKRLQAQGFLGWLDRAAERKEQRCKLSESLSRVQSSRLLRVWNSWGLYLQAQRRKDELMMLAVQHTANLGLGRGWRAWLGFVDARQRKKQLLRSAVALWENGLCGKAFARLRQLLMDKWKKAALANNALSRLNNSVLARCFGRWLQQVSTSTRERRQLVRAAAHFGGRLSALAFWTWLEWRSEKAERQLRARKALLHMSTQELSRSWRRWVEFAAEIAADRKAAAHAISHWCNRLLGTAFISWADWFWERERKRERAVRALEHWRHQVSGSALHGWLLQARAWQEKREKADRTFCHWRRRALVHTLAGWRERVRHFDLKRRGLLMALRFWRDRSIGPTFRGWVVRARELEGKRNALATAILFWSHKVIGSALRGWLKRTRELLEKHAKLLRAITYWSRTELRRAFLALVDNVVLADKLYRAVERWRHVTYAKVFISWHEVAVMQSRALCQWKIKTCTKAFRGWDESTRRCLYFRSVLERGFLKLRHRQMSIAFDDWAASWETSVQRRELADELRFKVVAKWKQTLLHRAYFVWWEQVVKLSAARAMLARLSDKAMFFAFANWREHCFRMEGVRDLLRRILGGIREAAFFNWRLAVEETAYERQSQDFIEEQLEGKDSLRAMAREVIKRWRRLPECRVLEQWMEYTCLMLDIKGKMESAFCKFYFSLSRRAFTVLHNNAREQREKTRVLSAAANHWMSRSMKNVLRCWSRTANELIIE